MYLYVYEYQVRIIKNMKIYIRLYFRYFLNFSYFVRYLRHNQMKENNMKMKFKSMIEKFLEIIEEIKS